MKQINEKTWQSDNGLITFIHGDCMGFMAGCKENEFELACVDPPYGIDGGVDNRNAIETKSGNNLRRFARKGGMNWDRETPPKEYFDELKRVSKNQIIWGGNYFINYLENTRCLICWNKMTYIPSMSQMEVAWTSFDRHTKYIKINSNQNDRIHISQKPVKLYRWIFKNYAKLTDHIFDSHGGSMSSAIAAHMEGLRMTIIELDEEYFQKAIKRFATYESQQTISFDL